MVSSNRQTGNVSNIDEIFADALQTPLARNAKFRRELEEVSKYYQFYDGYDILNMDSDYGQTWKITDNQDYNPTREIRNYVKKLVNRQAAFMMGEECELLFKPLRESDAGKEKDKRQLFDTILAKADFWTQAGRALIDATVGKRVLLAVTANAGEPIGIRFFPMPQFTYTLNDEDRGLLDKVDVVYQDDRTRGADTGDQIWHHYGYRMENGECILSYKMTDGDDRQLYIRDTKDNPDNVQLTANVSQAKLMKIVNNIGQEEEVPEVIKEETPTGLSQIPCRVILNDPLTGDIYGTSDVKELMSIAENYNRTISDLRDGLRFKMFEQPVIIDGDSKSIQNLRIAPNSLVDIKTSQSSLNSKQAKIDSIGGKFNFQETAKYYLDESKKAMYDLMDQPLPDKVQDAPSGIAMTYIFYELSSRCNWKWREWKAAITWMVGLLEEILSEVQIDTSYIPEHVVGSHTVPTSLSINQRYPIPEDEEGKKRLALEEVNANARSRKSYIEEFTKSENNQAEWDSILDELRAIEDIAAGTLPTILENINSQQTGTATEDNSDDTNGQQ